MRCGKPWTDDEIERLRGYAARGLSASQIAAAFGGARVRCAVIGAIRRYGLAKAWEAGRLGASDLARAQLPASPPPRAAEPAAAARVDKRARTPRPAVSAKPEPAAAPPPRPLADEPATVTIGPVTIVGLRDGHCRWPIGDPFDFDSFRYCGGLKLPITPYCLEHSLQSLSPEGQARFRRQYKATAA